MLTVTCILFTMMIVGAFVRLYGAARPIATGGELPQRARSDGAVGAAGASRERAIAAPIERALPPVDPRTA